MSGNVIKFRSRAQREKAKQERFATLVMRKIGFGKALSEAERDELQVLLEWNWSKYNPFHGGSATLSAYRHASSFSRTGASRRPQELHISRF